MRNKIISYLIGPLVFLFFILTGTLFAVSEGRSGNKASLPSDCPAAISFFIIDLKYSEAKGVQICEIQPGVVSKFSGYDYINGQAGSAAKNFCDCLSTLQSNLWAVSGRITDKTFVKEFGERGWNLVKDHPSLDNNADFAHAMIGPVFDPADIHGYKGLLYTRVSRLDSVEKFCAYYPGAILLDRATYKQTQDKYMVNKLLTDDPLLRKLKPAWNSYVKKYSSHLAEKIKLELGGEMFVIKPRRSTLGHGIIIVKKDHLGKVLKKVMGARKKALKNMEDEAYAYWRKDKSDSILIEAYAPSDAIHVPHLDNKLYDPTMRVGIVLVLSKGQIDVHFVACYWKLPLKSLDEKGSLTELHRSFGKSPYFAEVSNDVQLKIEKELRKTMPHMFEIMIDRQVH